MPIIVLAGDEEFELSRRLASLKQEVLEPAWASFNLISFHNPSILEISDAAVALPMGPGNRMVLIEQCELFTKKKGKDSSSKKKAASSEKATNVALDALDRALSMVSSRTWLVFVSFNNFDSTLKTSKIVMKYASVENFPGQRYWPGGYNSQLESWCRKEASRFNVTINNDAINYLLESTQANLRQISKEIENASIYLFPDTVITFEIVSLLSSHYAHVFSLLNHWTADNRVDALKDLEELLGRQSGIPIMALLQTSLSKWINIKALIEKLVNSKSKRLELSTADFDALATTMNIKPFALKMELSRIKSLTLDYLIKKRMQLTRLEALVKTGQMSDQHALALFISG